MLTAACAIQRALAGTCSFRGEALGTNAGDFTSCASIVAFVVGP
jgi:hypothetical protein